MTGCDVPTDPAKRRPSGSSSGAAERLEHARAVLADCIASEDVDPALGDILLRADQVETVRRVRAQLRRDGGCLLADDVGTGKTYVALAVAREWRRPLVVAPASLRATWAHAIRLSRVPCGFATHESLSRGRRPEGRYDGIVVDESHRFRATTRRHAELARLTACAPVLLLSATPMQNRVRELADQLALFLGEAAFALGPQDLTGWAVRSAAAECVSLPRVAPPRWIHIDAQDDEVLRAILALPPPPRAADAGDGGVLLTISLVRAWASSRAALLAAVRRRQRTLAAIEQCRGEGRRPSRAELRSWHAGDTVQLGFPTLLAASLVDGEPAAELTSAIDRERTALTALVGAIGRAPDLDRVRADAVRALRDDHDGASMIAFSEWASTVLAYWSALRGQPGVGMLTASEARIASGRISRDELLARFAPRARGAPTPAAHERVTLLLATDLLSEGLNLQDASVVVHLDLPWNPARLAQRVGRLRRPGGASEVATFLLSPPASASALLETEARLRTKLERAEHAIGHGIDVLPALGLSRAEFHSDTADDRWRADGDVRLSDAELRSEIARRLARWRTGPDRRPSDGAPVVAAAASRVSGWIAALDDGRLLASERRGERASEPTESPRTVLRAIDAMSGSPRRLSVAERESALGAMAGWLAIDWARRSSGLTSIDTPIRRRALRALDGALRDAPRHRRAATLASANTLRRALARPLPLGAERELGAVVDASASELDWIERAVAIVRRTPLGAARTGMQRQPSVRALILLGRESPGREQDE